MLDAERRAVVDHLPALSDMTPGRSGNLSVRGGDRFAITPTGVPYGEIEPADVPVVSLDGRQVAGETAPSSETPMHRRLYRDLDAGAVAHAHPPWATTLAVLRDPVPPVHYVLAHAGGPVPVADYATYGTEALADNAAEAMTEADTTACLLANHGLVATGTDAAAAVETARAVEATARLYCQARTIGEPTRLSADELETVVEKFEGYGQPDGT